MSTEHVIKVKPYPIKAKLIKAEASFAAEILKLTEHGYLMKSQSGHLYRVGQIYTVQFEVPGTHADVKCDAKVIKTYQDLGQYISKSAEKALMVEMHFIQLPPPASKAIKDFLRHIRQTHKPGEKK